MNRTIKVTGKSSIKVSPDYTRISIQMSDVLSEYDKCLEKSVEDLNVIVECIKEFGFERKELKTSGFEIIRKTEPYRDNYDDLKYRFIGYQYKQNLNFFFKNDNKRLGKILYALSHLSVVPEIKISYLYSDVETIKNKLLSLAIKDAKQKPKILTEEAGIQLCEILDIDYSWINVEFETNNINFCKSYALEDCSMSKAYEVDFEPDDIYTNDSVRITFRID